MKAPNFIMSENAHHEDKTVLTDLMMSFEDMGSNSAAAINPKAINVPWCSKTGGCNSLDLIFSDEKSGWKFKMETTPGRSHQCPLSWPDTG